MIRARDWSAAAALAVTTALVLSGTVDSTVTGGESSGSATDLAGDGRPDVLLIVTDDQRVDSLARMGTVWSELAGKGRLYEEAGAPTSLCCPARASILTGLYAHSTRVYSNSYPGGGWRGFVDEDLESRTLATALSAAGYRTGLVGKYLNGFANHAPPGYVPPGWDSFVSFASEMGYFDYALSDGTRYGRRPADYSTDVLARYAARFIRTTPADVPMFLYFAPWAPHDPFTPAPRHDGDWAGRMPSYDGPWVDENLSDKPDWIRGRQPRRQRDIDRDLAGMQESLMAVDDAVERLLGTLETTGRLENTLVIYLSDHGTTVGEHNLKIWKNLPYRSTTDIPLIVRWDDVVPPGTAATRLALNVDVAPTIAAAAGATLTAEGFDLLGDERRRGYPLEATYWKHGDSPPRHPAYCGYRTRRWMFARYADGTEELYDYRTDPYELHNRAGQERVLDRLRWMRRHARQTCTPTPPGFSW